MHAKAVERTRAYIGSCRYADHHRHIVPYSLIIYNTFSLIEFACMHVETSSKVQQQYKRHAYACRPASQSSKNTHNIHGPSL